MDAEVFAVIMAGGGGTRLWPLSRKTKPKQVLRLFADRTLFRVAIERIKPLIPTDNILVVTVADQAHLLMEQAPELSEENFILEPAPRGTASVIGLAAAILEKRSPGCVMACLTADHYVSNEAHFRELLQSAFQVASEDHLVTLGVSPTHPDTGYGYIQRGKFLQEVDDFEVFRVLAFKEKPDLAMAQEYLEREAFAWNSGMFVWKAARILEEMQRQMPDLYRGLMRIQQRLGEADEENVLQSVWEDLESQTIDYGIMEGAHGVVVIPADDLGWWDVGGWGRLFELSDADEQGNVLRSERVLALDTHGTLVLRAEDDQRKRLIATLGLEDMVIIDTEDVLLVCPRARAQEVRRLVHRLGESGFEEYR